MSEHAETGTSPSGAEAIAVERQRQLDAEGWTPEHDDEYVDGELVWAARAYAAAHNMPFIHPEHVGWPWHSDWWKPSEGPVRNLVKAGALIAAEIDRLQRASSGSSREDAS